ncbi:MAG: TM0996/MTH895 family glutaredoxin-like protein [Actinomycetia bacterium]|nr:TM0996/MTH895 family glutaredoxin-like protein [Actinomycetes bacterium]
MIIKVLGPGCMKCKTLKKLVKGVLEEKKVEAEIIEVKDFAEILKYPITFTPGLVINEEIKIQGKIPSKNELIKIFEEYC